MATIRLKGKNAKRLETHRRCYRNFDPVIYRSRLANVDWEEMYAIEDVDVANEFLEGKIIAIMDDLCPIKVIQFKKNYKRWVTGNK